MNKVIFLTGLFLSLLIGFLFAGIYGALAMGIILSLTISIIKSNFKTASIIYKTILFAVIGYLIMISVGLLNAEDSVHNKVNAIRNELKHQGYHPKWVIISQKRYEFYNNLLINSVKNGRSKHLKGLAIDLYVYDINGDGTYDIKDFELLKKASQKVGKANPKIRGNVYDYLDKGFFSRRMIHVEVK